MQHGPHHFFGTLFAQIERLSPDRQITAQDIDCLKEAFALFDSDRDGEITVKELGKVRKGLLL